MFSRRRAADIKKGCPRYPLSWENATKLTESIWKNGKVPQKQFKSLQPSRLAELAALLLQRLL
ncbi:MAG: hypothetical protein ACRD3T_20230 [Terriglobia bacterium]